MKNDVIMLSADRKKHIGAQVRKKRLKHRLSLVECARLLHMSVEELARMEDGDFELYDDIDINGWVN